MLLTCQGAIGVKVGALTVATTLHLSNKKNKKKLCGCLFLAHINSQISHGVCCVCESLHAYDPLVR